MAIWDAYLSENDRKALSLQPGAPTLAASKPRAQQGFGERAALLVIDMQNVSCGEDRPIHEQLDRYPSACGTAAWAAVRHMQKLLPAARAAGIPLIYTKQLFRPHTGLPQAQPSSAYSSLNPLSEIVPELAMQEGDLLIEKQTPSAFFGTTLITSLLNPKIDTLILVGNSTSGCVRATAIDAKRGYQMRVSVIEECVFDRIEFSHAASLFDLQFKYCDVIDLPTVYRYFDSLQGKARR